MRLGYAEAAADMAQRVSRAVLGAGLREYYDPYTGEGMGARAFSWSSLVLELTDPDDAAVHSHVEGDARAARDRALDRR